MSQGVRAGSLVAGYRLLQPLGEGAQSHVYLARRGDSGPTVALKLTDLGTGPSGATAGEAFLRAAHLAQNLAHPNIVTVIEAGIEGPLGWLAMEAVPGSDLVPYTHKPRLLPLNRVLRLGEQLAEALGHAHRQGIVHRDVKPGNVLVNLATDTVKLADFGLARTDGTAHTGTGIVLGTPVYMAPEQLAGALPSASTDLYALGVVLFELLTGRLPHENPSMGRLLQAVIQTPAPELGTMREGLPVGLSALLTQLLAKTADQRPADASVVATHLRKLQDLGPATV